jgi:hypothetical protein
MKHKEIHHAISEKYPLKKYNTILLLIAMGVAGSIWSQSKKRIWGLNKK